MPGNRWLCIRSKRAPLMQTRRPVCLGTVRWRWSDGKLTFLLGVGWVPKQIRLSFLTAHSGLPSRARSLPEGLLAFGNSGAGVSEEGTQGLLCPERIFCVLAAYLVFRYLP